MNGVYKSTDGGSTWTASNGSLTPWATANGTFIDVESIVVDPSAPQTLYIGTNGRGVFKSTDGATSWTNILAPTAAIGCLLVVPGTPSTIYACIEGSGIQQTSNGGTAWTDVSQGLPSLDANGLTFDAADGQSLRNRRGGRLREARVAGLGRNRSGVHARAGRGQPSDRGGREPKAACRCSCRRGLRSRTLSERDAPDHTPLVASLKPLLMHHGRPWIAAAWIPLVLAASDPGASRDVHPCRGVDPQARHREPFSPVDPIAHL